MKVLIVTYKYPPVLSPRAFRWGEVAEWLAQRGDEVAVVCSQTPGAPSQEDRERVRVLRVGTGLGTVSSWPQDVQDGPAGGTGQWHRLQRAWRAAFRWPDYARTYYLPALQAALALAGEVKLDAVVSVSHPFTPHLVGLALKRRLGIRWIADMGDPFALPGTPPLNNSLLFATRNRNAERSVLAHADSVAVTNQETLAAFERTYRGVAGKLTVIPPLAPIVANVPHSGAEPGAGPRLMVAGRLYRKMRSPILLLEVFRRLRELPGMGEATLHVYGSTRDCADHFKNPQYAGGVVLHGVVPREEVLAAYSEADGVVNIGNANGLQLPSKVAELASLGKLILNFCSNSDDASCRFLLEHPLALQITAGTGFDPRHEAKRIVEALSAPTSEAEMERIERFMVPYRIDAVAGAYRRLLSCGS
ncbi:MAG: glycosyltransferase [Armatimonadetes bacterium]|nr:glycosyltransferase [Armatimonadota bacterium]